MTDSINRQVAIDALDYCQTYLFDARDHDKKVSLEDVVYAIEQVPPTRPEWTPVDKELPKDGTKCLVTQKFGKVRHVSKATYACDLYKVNQYDFCDKKNTAGFYYFDDEYGYVEVLDVTAWMPEPEPWED